MICTYNTKQVCKRLGLSYSKVREEMDNGELSFYLLGKAARRVSEDQLKEYLAKREMTCGKRERAPTTVQRKAGARPVLKHIRL